MKLTHEAFERARQFMHERARPLERALFAHEFEGAGSEPVLAALESFRNPDGGFGRALEPDLWLPDSSVLATLHGLHVLHDVHTTTDHAFVTGAVDWLVEAFDAELGAWRHVPETAEAHPHAAHWVWELHRDGLRWPVGVLPRAEVLAHLHRSPGRVPAELLADQTSRLVADFERSEEPGGDALLYLDYFARTEAAPVAAREAVTARLRQIGPLRVERDPGTWHSYVIRPLKIAPSPYSILAEDLAADVQRNLDYEIAHQQADGSWKPTWSWSGFPDEWIEAERAWRGHLTLEALRSLGRFGRIEGH